ncbi:molybdate-anion transporter-like [Tubulanus polymorphus]|uniref:molybdate-anion transporter-like n=1 Tax=Tubulanus polymorphus TaxID=672921 RepID=UPI003DA6A8B2
MIISYVALFILGLICIGLQLLSIRSRVHPAVGNNPIFLKFQYVYFAAYFPALLADWLQGPYLYRLYSHYEFDEFQIAVIYSCGFASTVLLGTWAPIAADRFGRRKLCVFFTVIYSVACFMKLSRSYGVLIIARVLSGVSTSLLFYAFEAWYVHEHLESNDFPKEWIPVTFAKATVWNGVLAIIAGVVANVIAEWLHAGPVAPFILAVPCLLISGIVVMAKWDENYGKRNAHFKRSMTDGLKCILSDQRIFLIGVIQSLFESVMYIFVFLWTPVLSKSDPPYGVVFACFMVCIMIGSAVFHVLASKRVPVVSLLAGAVLLSSISVIICVFSTHPADPKRSVSFLAFLLMEIGVGIYFPAMGFVRMKIIPEQHTISVVSWFRVPLNLIACCVLMIIHDHEFKSGNRIIFVTCAFLLAVAMLCLLRFSALVKNNQSPPETVEMQPVAATETAQNLQLVNQVPLYNT